MRRTEKLPVVFHETLDSLKISSNNTQDEGMEQDQP